MLLRVTYKKLTFLTNLPTYLIVYNQIRHMNEELKLKNMLPTI